HAMFARYWSSDVCSSDLERWYGFDDGIYSAGRLLEILALDRGDPSEALNALPGGVSTPEIKVEVADGNPHGFVARFQDRAKFEEIGRASCSGRGRDDAGD